MFRGLHFQDNEKNPTIRLVMLWLVLIESCFIVFRTVDAQSTFEKCEFNPVFSADPGLPMVFHDNDKFKMYYSDRIGSSVRHQIEYRESDNGSDWSSPITVLEPTSSGWESQSLYYPFVFKDETETNPSKRYKMWYSGHGGSGGQFDIGYTYSADGINGWESNRQMVLNGAQLQGLDELYLGCIIKQNNLYKMWYYARLKNSGNLGFWYVTSSKPDDWPNDIQYHTQILGPIPENNWHGQDIVRPFILYMNGLYHMWYDGKDDNGNRQIGYTFSTNETDWTQNPSILVLPIGCEGDFDSQLVGCPTVVFHDSRYHLWYRGNYGDIGYADGPIDKITILVDIKPGSFPNPLNIRSNGVLPVAILGESDFDVSDIDPSTLELEGISPVRWNIEDVTTPDGYDDIILKFKTQEIVDVLGDVEDGEEIELTISGNLKNGTPIEGKDVVVMIANKMKKLIASKEDMIPTGYSLFPNHPNPFNPETRIRYTVPEQAHVRMEIYNITGKKVITLVDGVMTAGYHSVTWNGKDDFGNVVSGGLYLCRIRAGTYSKIIRMLFLK